MTYHSKAPLRIGLAGGGTDVSPYSDLYGGAVLNAAISLYAHATIEINDEKGILLSAVDRNEEQQFEPGNKLPVNGKLDLLKAVYNRMLKDYELPVLNFKLSTFVDVPLGSGLGTSSTLVVAIIGAFKEMLQFSMSDNEIAHYAYEIERKDLQHPGGKQDQYAAVFGGINYMEFFESDQVNVTRLEIKPEYLKQLENNLLLWYTSTGRDSAAIIKQQAQNVIDQKQEPVEAMHQLKQQAQKMKEVLMKGRLDELGDILDFGFQQKRKMADGISNNLIEDIYETAKSAGATGGKISGAGGGGFMIFYCPGNTKQKVIESLEKFGGGHRAFHFEGYGLTSWVTT